MALSGPASPTSASVTFSEWPTSSAKSAPRIAVRFDREDWYFFHPGDDAVHVTDGGNYRVKHETALAAGTDFDELVGHSEKVTLDEVGEDGPDRATLDILDALKRGDLTKEEAAEMLG